jgi:hypothetical protein
VSIPWSGIGTSSAQICILGMLILITAFGKYKPLSTKWCVPYMPARLLCHVNNRRLHVKSMKNCLLPLLLLEILHILYLILISER